MGTGVQPGVAALHDLHVKLAPVKVGLVDGSGLQFAPDAGFDGPRDVHHLLVVKVQVGDGEIALVLGRFFLNSVGLAVFIEGHHAVAFGVLHMVGKHRGAARLRVSFGQ